MLRQNLVTRGLGDFISKDTAQLIERMKAALAKPNEIDMANFDPLVSAHNTICQNAVRFTAKVNGNVMGLIGPPVPEHPEWECPICFLNWMSADHDRVCIDPLCPKTKGQRFEDWIDKAAAGTADYMKRKLPS